PRLTEANPTFRERPARSIASTPVYSFTERIRVAISAALRGGKGGGREKSTPRPRNASTGWSSPPQRRKCVKNVRTAHEVRAHRGLRSRSACAGRASRSLQSNKRRRAALGGSCCLRIGTSDRERDAL